MAHERAGARGGSNWGVPASYCDGRGTQQRDRGDGSPALTEAEAELLALLRSVGADAAFEALREERVDVEALRLMEELDLKEAGVPLGPRKKLLHANVCSAAAGRAPGGEGVHKAKRQQVAQACMACKRAKAKCSSERPCGRCVRMRLECVETGPIHRCADGQLFANGASEAAGACAGLHPSKVVQDVTPQRSPPHDVTLQRPHGATGHVQAACHPDGAMRDLLHADQIRLEVQVETILHEYVLSPSFLSDSLPCVSSKCWGGSRLSVM